MAFLFRSTVIASLLGLAALLGNRTSITLVQAEAGQNDREPILMPNVQEPEEMRVAPFPVQNAVLTPADRMLGEAIEAKGKNDANAMLSAINRVIASYPDYAPAYVMRLGPLCEGNDKDAVLSDINNALKFSSSTTATFSDTMKQSGGSLYGMLAKIEYLKGDYTSAITDLENAVHVDLAKPTDFINSGAVRPETTASICTWTQLDVDGLVQRFPADYRPYMFRALYDGFFLFFDEDEKTQQDALNRAFADLNIAAKLNPSSVLPHLFKAEIFRKTFGLRMMSIYDPRHDELNEMMLSLLNDTIAIDHNNVWALGHRAAIYFDLQNFRRAIADYDRVLALDPQDFDNLNDRGEAKLRIGDTYDAISDLSEVIRNKEDYLQHSQSYDRAQYADSYEARADAYMKTRQWDLAIRDLTTAISLKVGAQVWLANIHQFRALYPEYATATDEAITQKLQQTFFPNLSYEGFKERFLHKNGSFGFPDFVIADIYLKRSDVYLKKGNWNAAKRDFKRAERGYPNAPDAIDRWREISPLINARVYVDMKTFNDERHQAVNLWIKEVRGDNGPYSIEQFELNCGARQLRLISSASYDAAGNFTGSRPGNNWTSIVPETLGENLYDGVCVAN